MYVHNWPSHLFVLTEQLSPGLFPLCCHTIHWRPSVALCVYSVTRESLSSGAGVDWVRVRALVRTVWAVFTLQPWKTDITDPWMRFTVKLLVQSKLHANKVIKSIQEYTLWHSTVCCCKLTPVYQVLIFFFFLDSMNHGWFTTVK